MKNTAPMDFHGALGALRTIIKERPDTILVNEGANTLDLARGVIDMYQPRKRLDVGTWGVMGIGMGYAVGAAIETGKPVLAVEGDSAFGFSGMEVETICRYDLPVCVVVFNNDGIYRGTNVNTGGPDPATTVFVKDSRYDKMMEAFGGVGVHVTTPDELSRAVNKAMDSRKPTLINAVIDPAAGSESGRIGNLNPQSVVRKTRDHEGSNHGQEDEEDQGRRAHGRRKAQDRHAAGRKKVVRLRSVAKSAPRKPARKAKASGARKASNGLPKQASGLPKPSALPWGAAGKALDGVRILDFTHVQSGPTCTQLLGYMGADVIKIERPGVGDITRGQLRDVPNADSLYFTMLNGNKRSITVNSNAPKGKEIISG